MCYVGKLLYPFDSRFISLSSPKVNVKGLTVTIALDWLYVHVCMAKSVLVRVPSNCKKECLYL